MAYSLIAHVVSGGPANATTTGAIDTSGANLLVASAGWYSVVTPSGTMSDSKGNTWTPLTKITQPTDWSNQLFYCYGATVGSGHTFSFSGSFTFASLEISAWSGSVASPFDQQNGAYTGSTTVAPGSVTPSENNELIIAGLAYDNSGGSASINGGFTISDSIVDASGNNVGGGMAYLIQTSLAAANPTWTISGSVSQSIATIATFKASSGGGGSTVKYLAAVGVG